MNRHTYSSGPWKHMPQKREPYLTGGEIGVIILAALITLLVVTVLSKTLPEAACYHANYDNPEACINDR